MSAALSVTDLRDRLPGLMLRDQRRLARRLDDPRVDLSRVASDIARAEERVSARRTAVPSITYPEQLPVAQVRQDIAAAVRDHQVVVLAGETGSGKTTQLPKILLELGRGVTGLVGHTQPRRIAARAVAERVAEELGTELGDLVGYTVRFHDQVADSTLV
ncbi:MAG: ATP-dependent helicase HrpA [Frankiales bacterium]|nr:ATP-dependent helicase HrpA [Frankiales bacterium]